MLEIPVCFIFFWIYF